MEVKVYPLLIEINGVSFYAHGFFLNLAFLVCAWVVFGEARRRNWPKNEVIPITLAAFVDGMMGARLSIVFFNGWETAPVVLDFFRLFDPRIGPELMFVAPVMYILWIFRRALLPGVDLIHDLISRSRAVRLPDE